MSRKQEWVAYAGRALGGLDPLERRLAEAAATVLSSGISPQLDLDGLKAHDKRCAAALVAIIEVARAVSVGKTPKAEVGA